MSLVGGVLALFHLGKSAGLVGGLGGLVCVLALWWRDVVAEATYGGMHTTPVARGLRLGMVLFIGSEVMFFFSFFWAFFHRAVAPGAALGGVWPPVGIVPVDPWAVPLLNTRLLLASGVAVTWRHHALLEGVGCEAKVALFLGILMGAVFTAFQGLEMYHARFAIRDGVYGSLFYMMTGFHGLHVVIGRCFLGVNLYRMWRFHWTGGHHLGFEFGAWY